MTLRRQVMEVINHVLTDPDPEREWARTQLRELLAAHPGEPERALLEHLIATRSLTGAAEDETAPHPEESGAVSSLPADRRNAAVPFERGSRKRIEAVLGNRMLLTAFQPIRELPTGKVTGFEALARFVSRDGASADTWFREAAAIGLGPDLEIAALQCALSAAREIPAHLFVAFNLSPKTFTDSLVQGLLENSHVPMDRIIIELTGRVEDDAWNALIRTLKPLRQRGLRIAVDGSGDGFTSAECIRKIRPDIIKLDRHFIEGIMMSPDGDRNDPAVIGLALEIGAVLAAEGIETQAELTAVIEAGMTAGQGYLLGRPSVHPLDWSAWIIQTEAVSARPSAPGPDL
jgi:EAL domain-containing protein (putative c-di-GMP-specific phosphodiesterase class I)